ncbi:MAG: HYR domain-containing protein [Verrucomicrobiaceae bacterium]|nr:HYR domain-containing protein [Verrucomicrobiaceae bacterium]
MNRPFRFVFALLSLSASVWAVDGTFIGQGNGSATTANYSDTTKWSGGTVAGGTGATATINLNGSTGAGATAITVTAPVTIGNLTLTNSSGANFSLTGNGTAANSTITWATSSGTPTLYLATWFGKTYTFGGGSLTFAGTQGLTINTGSNVFSPTGGGLSWSGYSGTLTVTANNNDGGTIDPQTGNTLPQTHLTLTPGTGSSSITLGMFAGRDQTIGGFDGAAATYVRNNSTSFSTLTLGTNNDSGNFQGVFGKNVSSASTDFRSNINITKNGTGTQKFSGTSYSGGTTTINGGAFLMNGTHTATVTASGNLAAATGTGGKYNVNNTGTLGGTGTIKPFDTAGGGVMIDVKSGGKIAPGDPATSSGVGTLTIDQTASNQSVLNFSTGGTVTFDLNTSGNDKVAFVGKAGTTEVFYNSTVLNFTDLSAGLLTSGQYVLFQGDADTNYGGLTTDGSGFITAGLSIGSGLSSYTSTSLQLVGNNIVLNLTNPNAPVPVALSFNVKGTSNTGMTSVEVAGASGARFANWNNFSVTSGNGSISNLVDSNGAQVTGVSVTMSSGNGGTTFNRGISSPSNDTRMFDTVHDKYDGTAATISVTGIPYGTYDVYFYMADDGAARGGSFTVGGTTYYLRGGAGTPTSSGTGYVQSTDTTFNSGADTQANYVKFTGLSGTLTATFTALNEGDSVQRLKFPGFQIVGTASPANTAPAAPASLAITANSTTSYTLNWSAVNGATSYQIFRSSTSGSFNFASPLASVSAPTLSYTDTTASAGTIYYYVVRAVNGVGSSSSSSEVTNPPPDLSSVVASSPVIWPGGSSTLSWAIPNADTLTIDSGSGPQSYATTGTLTVTPSVTTNYIFSAVNVQGTTNKTVTITLTPKPNTRDSLWQWSIPLTSAGISTETNDYPRAFLYIPPGVTTVRGVLIGQHNMLEEPVMEHNAVRQGLADAGMAAIWVTPAFDGGFNFTANPNTPAIFQAMMDGLAAESGYAELSKTPVVWLGHSAMSEAPYFFAAWDTQHAVATGEPKRCAAAISLQGFYPGRHNADQPTYSNSDLAGTPLMYIEGEYADANGRATSTLSFRNSTAGTIISFLGEPGGGHFDWNDRNCEYIGMYLRKLGTYRLPATAAADGTAVLQTINTSTQGYLADRWRKGQSPTASPAAVGSYSGNTSEAFWYFDQEHAETTHNAYLPVKTTYQLVGYTQNGALVNQIESHLQVEPSFVPDPTGDGLTFKYGTAFLSTVPATSSRLAGWTGLPVGSAIGHSTSADPILISRIAGPVEQLSPDTFRIRFDRVGTNNIYGQTRSRDIVLMAVHPGDSTYVRAVQQSQTRIPLPLTSGTAQTITFTQPADQLNGTSSINLSASTTGTATYAGATVDFYVRQGPAKVSGNTLTFTSLPARTKFPVKVTVVATQYGRTIAPLLQTATPVTRTFWIHKDAKEQWRHQTFGTLGTNGTTGEPEWTLSANSDDSADFDNDGLTNLEEYLGATDPKVDSVAPTISAPVGGFTTQLTTGVGGTAALPDYLTEAVITDSNGVTSSSQSPPSGTLLAIGSTTVTLSASDAVGNLRQVTVIVIVTDGTPPSIAAPVGGFTPSSITTATALPDYTSQAVTSDNVGVVNVLQSPAPGSTQSAGSVSVTLTASDAAGNTASTMFTVTVIAAEVTTTTLASKGGAVPRAGTPGSGIPSGALWTKLGIPAINEAGQLVVYGEWKAGTASGAGIFVGSTSSSDMQLIVSKGSPAPGLPNIIIGTFKEPILGPDGSVAWVAGLANATGTTGNVVTTNNAALFLDADGTGPTSPVLVSRKGSPAAGLSGELWSSFDSIVLGEGAIGLLGKLVISGAVTSASDQCLWVYDRSSSTMSLALRESGSLLGSSVKVIGGLVARAAAGGHGGGIRNNGVSDQIAVRVSLADKRMAVGTILEDVSVTFDYLSSSSADAFGGGATWKSFGLPGQNSAGALTFLGVVQGGSSSTANNTALFTEDDSTFTLAKRASKGSSAGIGGGVFAGFKDPVNASAGAYAFVGSMAANSSAGITTSNNDGVWHDDGVAGPILIAREGAQAPGASDGAKWKTFTSIALPDGRAPVFYATLLVGPGGTTTGSDTGIWAVDYAGEVKKVIQEGDTFGTSTVKGFKALLPVTGSPAQARSFNGAGSIAIQVTDAAGGTHLVLTNIP